MAHGHAAARSTYLQQAAGAARPARQRLATPVEDDHPRRASASPSGPATARPERFDDVIIAAHSDQALAMLGDASQRREERPVGASPTGRTASCCTATRADAEAPRRLVGLELSALERATRDEQSVCVTYWMNRLQGIDDRMPLFVSLNPMVEPRAELTFGEWSFDASAVRRARPCRRRRGSTTSRACAAPGSPAPGPATAFTKTACAPAWTRRSRSAHGPWRAASGEALAELALAAE